MAADRRLALVSGAASGIGAAIAQALLEDFEVVGFDLREGAADFRLVQVDVTRRQDVEKAVRDATDQYGPARLLVNNAGILTMNRFLDLGDNEWRTVFDVNVYGVYLLGQVVARTMAQAGGGRIINIASVAGKAPLQDQAHYCASKAAVIMLTRVMALELARADIRVFAVCPGAVDTDMFRQCLSWTAARDGREEKHVLQEWLAPSRLGRLIEPQEVASLVRFLATGPVDAMTGHAVSFDGGVAQW